MEQLAPRGSQVEGAANRPGRGWLPSVAGAVLLVAVWALTGPVLGFSDTLQLFIDTTAAVLVLWSVFVIQDAAGPAPN